jgi:hypothetical protein
MLLHFHWTVIRHLKRNFFPMGEMEVTRRRGRRHKKLLDDLKDRRGYSHFKEEALDRTMWSNRFGGGFGPVVWQNTEWMNGVKTSSGPRSPHYRNFTITLRHTTLDRTPLDDWSARRTDLVLLTHITHTREFYTPGGIPTPNPSKRAPVDPRLRPRGHRDPHMTIVSVPLR